MVNTCLLVVNTFAGSEHMFAGGKHVHWWNTHLQVVNMFADGEHMSAAGSEQMFAGSEHVPSLGPSVANHMLVICAVAAIQSNAVSRKCHSDLPCCLCHRGLVGFWRQDRLQWKPAMINTVIISEDKTDCNGSQP